MAGRTNNDRDFPHYEREVFRYIKKEERVISWSGIFPLILVAFNSINLFVAYRWLEFYDVPVTEGFVRITPIIVGIILASFAFVQFFFLWVWTRKVHAYGMNTGQNLELNKGESARNGPASVDPRSKTPTLPSLLYSLANFMGKLKIVFIVILACGAFYIAWVVWFVWESWALRIFWIPQAYFMVVWGLNVASVVVVGIFLVFEGRILWQWMQKLERLSQFEKQVLDELHLEEG